MKALIYILAIVLMAAGVAIGLISFFSPGQVVLGLNLGLAASLLTGGVVTLGLAGVITALDDLVQRLGTVRGPAAGEAVMPSQERMAKVLGTGAVATAATTAAAEEVATAAPEEVAKEKGEEEAAEEEGKEEAAEEEPRVERQIFVSPRPETEAKGEAAEAEEPAKAAEEAAPEEAGEAAEEGKAEAKEEAAEEEAAEEEATEEAVEETAAEAGEEAGEEADVEGLYVVEERIIRGRPARMLSDGTVEAETDEGWMRFENLEHLEEYMEAMSHAR